MSSKFLLLAIAFASLELPARGGDLLAKPARVPFTENDKDGVILVHVSAHLQPHCSAESLVHIADEEENLLESKAHIGDITSSHTDQFGRQWMHVSVNLHTLPLGATTVKVTACGASVSTKASLLHYFTYSLAHCH